MVIDDKLIERGIQTARAYLETNRWLARRVNEDLTNCEADTLMLLGSYPSIDITPKVITRVFSIPFSSAQVRVAGLRNKGFVEPREGKRKRDLPIKLSEAGKARYLSLVRYIQSNIESQPIDDKLPVY